jgi:hypothetical protein
LSRLCETLPLTNIPKGRKVARSNQRTVWLLPLSCLSGAGENRLGGVARKANGTSLIPGTTRASKAPSHPLML